MKLKAVLVILLFMTFNSPLYAGMGLRDCLAAVKEFFRPTLLGSARALMKEVDDGKSKLGETLHSLSHHLSREKRVEMAVKRYRENGSYFAFRKDKGFEGASLEECKRFTLHRSEILYFHQLLLKELEDQTLPKDLRKMIERTLTDYREYAENKQLK